MAVKYKTTGGVEMQFKQPANDEEMTAEELVWVSFGDILEAGLPIDDDGEDLEFMGKYRVNDGSNNYTYYEDKS